MTTKNPLSELQQDLLTELFNVGVGHAAASLSTMVKQEIKLSVPVIEFISIKELAQKLGANKAVYSVSQKMSGPFSAQSILFFPEKSSGEIVRKLLGDDLPEDSIAELQKEAFSEIGNIVLNACIGSFSNALNNELTVELPTYEFGKPEEVLEATDNAGDTALFIKIDLTLSTSHITGYMAFLMEGKSLEKLIAVLDEMLKKYA